MSAKPKPYWQDQEVNAAVAAAALPSKVDILIIGGGYTGLSAARETALAGASTLVLEAGALGAGCSGRNGGQIAYSLKPSLGELTSRHGAARAMAICQEGRAALDYIKWLATEEGEDCGWRQDGCFFGAFTPRHFTTMTRDAGNQPAGLEQNIVVVPKAEQKRYIDTDFYHGGCFYPDDASVDPMRLLRALLRRARAAGATFIEQCPALSIRPRAQGFEVATAQGPVQAGKVLIATNGYSGPLSEWHRRRVIPIGSYQIATEALGADVVNALIPEGRNIVDSRRVVVYYRPSTDRQRIIFGGRAALAETDPAACTSRLQAMLTQVLPQLKEARIEYTWLGWVAYTFDTMPHLGQHEGVHYCMGYCGQGVPTAPYFGQRIGQQMVGRNEGRTALDGLPFPTRPYYRGTPWFLAPTVFAYRLLDSFGL